MPNDQFLDETEQSGMEIMRIKRPTGWRWVLCLLLFAATAINYMDRAVLGILAHTLQQDLHWSEESYSHIVVAFTFAYGLGYLLAGYLIDRVGVKIGYTLSVSLWTVAAMAHAAVTSVLGFGFVRFLLGLGESGNFPASIRAISESFAPEERALAIGLFNSGSNASSLIAPFFIAEILQRTGSWRAAFLGVGGLGLIWIICWVAFPYDRLLNLDSASAVGPAKTTRDGWKQLITLRQTWAFIFIKAATDPVWWLYLLWLPKFLQERFHLSVMQIGAPLATVYCVSSVGAVEGGWLSGYWIKKGLPALIARKRMLFWCSTVALSLIFATHLGNLLSIVALFSLLTAMHQGWAATLFAATSDVFSRQSLSLAVGIGGAAGALGGILFQELTGYILQRTHGNYNIVFVLAALAYPISYVAFNLLTQQKNNGSLQSSIVRS